MLTLRTFDPQDSVTLAKGAIGQDLTSIDVLAYAKYNAMAGPAYSCYMGDKLVAVAGVRRGRNGSGTPWFLLGAGCQKYGKSILQSCRLMLDILVEECEFKYLRTHSEIGFPQSQRLLEHLGFKRLRTIMHGTHYYYKREA